MSDDDEIELDDENAARFNRTPDGKLGCAFGEPWLGDHPKCRDEADRLEREFWIAVSIGTYDEDGYTPADRRVTEPIGNGGRDRRRDAIKKSNRRITDAKPEGAGCFKKRGPSIAGAARENADARTR